MTLNMLKVQIEPRITAGTSAGLRSGSVTWRNDCQRLAPSIFTAVKIDGASRWQSFRHVTLPLLKPALVPAVILGSIWTFNMFNVIYLVSGGGPDHQTNILITEASVIRILV